MRIRNWAVYCLLIVLVACRTARNDQGPFYKYSPDELREDLRILNGVLRTHHPGLYWYQQPDTWNQSVKAVEAQLHDSLTEPVFRKLLRRLTAEVRCGHTSIQSARSSQRYQDTVAIRNLFPLSLKCWKDTMVVLGNLDTQDSILTRGVQILSINGRSARSILDTLSLYVSGDGFNRTHPDQILSGWGTFGNYYRQYLDTSSVFSIEYVDRGGEYRMTERPLFVPKKDTSRRVTTAKLSKREQRKQQLERTRSIQIDTSNRQALMRITSFGQGAHLRKFFKKGFKLLKENKIEDLILDVRNNGGGRVGNSTDLSRYISQKRFRIADTLYAVSRNSPYGKYIRHNWAVQAMMPILTKKKKDGRYHFGYFERHFFTPRKNNHYNGRTYILTSGYSFSATTLFINVVKGQPGVTVVGEETGGGAYGNSAWEIPTVVLPNTGIRLRLPLFRMVMDKRLPNNGRGIFPDVEVGATPESIRMNYDNKMRVTQELIRENRRKGS